ncbi:MAG TPA: CDP-alcohol phosphatidyltransferase family protein [Proteobacteria bacterium]|nr:putative CDP-diacylglycerol--glycerol-3-phosphate 3-phosphatidyl-transferase 2 [bacterium BMS3Abin14]HDL52933.1 CDP-alcohol phosphatidyltransferase family protein [Pseudomonadota bacterium]
MNLPNALTVIRILLIPLFLYEVLKGHFTFAFAVYMTAALTDALDGAIARLCHMQTALGAFLDPVADKMLATTSYLSLAFLHIVPLWLAIAVISRDIIIVAGSVAVYYLKNSLEIKPHPVSKLTTFFQITTILLALVLNSALPAAGWPVFVRSFRPIGLITGAMTVLSGAIYIFAGFRSIEE